MKHKFFVAFLILAVVAGVIGAAVSVGMVISAVQFSEWAELWFTVLRWEFV